MGLVLQLWPLRPWKRPSENVCHNSRRLKRLFLFVPAEGRFPRWCWRRRSRALGCLRWSASPRRLWRGRRAASRTRSPCWGSECRRTNTHANPLILGYRGNCASPLLFPCVQKIPPHPSQPHHHPRVTILPIRTIRHVESLEERTVAFLAKSFNLEFML